MTGPLIDTLIWVQPTMSTRKTWTRPLQCKSSREKTPGKTSSRSFARIFHFRIKNRWSTNLYLRKSKSICRIPTNLNLKMEDIITLWVPPAVFSRPAQSASSTSTRCKVRIQVSSPRLIRWSAWFRSPQMLKVRKKTTKNKRAIWTLSKSFTQMTSKTSCSRRAQRTW